MKEIQVHFIRHKSAKDIVVSYVRFDHPRMKLTNLLKTKTEFELTYNDIVHYPRTVGNLIKTVKDLGLWGYCDKITYGKFQPVIHYWISKEALTDRIKVMELFGHEVTHAMGFSSENLAVRGGVAAGLAYLSMMEELYDNTSTNDNNIR